VRKKKLPEEILDLFKKRMKMEYEYIKSTLYARDNWISLMNYYKLEDDECRCMDNRNVWGIRKIK